jgi:hypothetical protein
VTPGPSPLELTREQILAFRRRVQALDERLPPGATSLRRAAWAGLQDSMPRAALLSLHARVEGIGPTGWEDPELVQLWGPRFSAYVVPRRDLAVFSLGRYPENPRRRRRDEDIAARLESFLEGRSMSATEIGLALGVDPNELRHAAPTGRVLIRWDGARQPTVWMVPAPKMDVATARLELARRHLHFYGPSTPGAFSDWAGIKPPVANAAFDGLIGSLIAVRTPIGEAWMLEEDEAAVRAPADTAGATRLLPSGDTYFLLQGAERELLVSDPARRSNLWTPRVWPGAVLLAGALVGTWRRAGAVVTVESWRRLSRAERESVEAEAASMPLPGIDQPIVVRWLDVE